MALLERVFDRNKSVHFLLFKFTTLSINLSSSMRIRRQIKMEPIHKVFYFKANTIAVMLIKTTCYAFLVYLNKCAYFRTLPGACQFHLHNITVFRPLLSLTQSHRARGKYFTEDYISVLFCLFYGWNSKESRRH